MPDKLIDFARMMSANIRETHGPAPVADVFDPISYPFGVKPGGNKLGLMVCALCGKPPTVVPSNEAAQAFLFRDERSAKEYKISGMCQACQDAVFKPEGDDGE
jgi:hypothetical protein